MTYAAPSTYNETPKYYSAPSYTTKAPEYYTTKKAEYYTTTYAAPTYYTTTYAAPAYKEAPKY